MQSQNKSIVLMNAHMLNKNKVSYQEAQTKGRINNTTCPIFSWVFWLRLLLEGCTCEEQIKSAAS